MPAGWKSFSTETQTFKHVVGIGGRGLLAGVNQYAAQLVTSYSNITEEFLYSVSWVFYTLLARPLLQDVHSVSRTRRRVKFAQGYVSNLIVSLFSHNESHNMRYLSSSPFV